MKNNTSIQDIRSLYRSNIFLFLNLRKSISLPWELSQISLSSDINKSYNFQISALSCRYILYRILEANDIFYRILMPRKWLTRRYCWSGYTYGWNVCAVRCKFARKHIPHRTWVHTVATSCVGRSGTSKSIEQANYCPDNMRAFKSITVRK